VNIIVSRFGVYEFVKDYTIQSGINGPMYVNTLPFSQTVVFSMIAGAMGGIAGNPADIVNIRMQADGRSPPDQRRNYKHAIDGLVRITRRFSSFI